MAIPTVTITGKIYLPDGQVATAGSVTCALSLSGSAEDGGVSQRVGGRRTFTIEADGDIETGAALVPNTAITPTGTFYRVTFNITSPVVTVWSEAWSIASTPNPIEIGDIVRLDTAGGPTGPASAIQYAIIDAKGDIIAGTGADLASRLGVGADGSILTADSTQATGLAWLGSSVVIRSFTALGLAPFVTTSAAVGVADNQIMSAAFYLPTRAEFDRYTYRIDTAAPFAPSGFIAIYSEDGLSKVWAADGLDWTTPGEKTHSITLTPIPAGRYLIAIGFGYAATRIYSSVAPGVRNIRSGYVGVNVADGTASPAAIPNLTGAANVAVPAIHFYKDAA